LACRRALVCHSNIHLMAKQFFCSGTWWFKWDQWITFQCSRYWCANRTCDQRCTSKNARTKCYSSKIYWV